MGDSRVAKADEPQEEKKSMVVAASDAVRSEQEVVRFRGRAMILDTRTFPHYKPLHKDKFEEIAYPILGGITRSKMSDIFAYLCNTARDVSEYEDYILFGSAAFKENEDGQLVQDNHSPDGITGVWDMDELRLKTLAEIPADNTIWRSPYARVPTSEPLEFVMQLAGGDQGLYDDIMQSLAPIIMRRKPDGAIWWVGDGANGKSTLMDALYQIFPDQFSSITVKRLEDGRDTPSLNGTLANIVKESSEGRVDDTEIYKAIGTHENFRVHKFHSQDDIEVRGNLHHIFSANAVPVFNDKQHSARRRTFIIPFLQQFPSDPTFEQRTFTPEFFGKLISEMIKYAVRLRAQGYKYKWSGTTTETKLDYDKATNNAEEFMRELIVSGVVAFTSFIPLQQEYENWCAENGYVPFGRGKLANAAKMTGFQRLTFRADNAGANQKHYRLPTVQASDLVLYRLGKPGLFTVPGFRRDDLVSEDAELTTTETTTLPPPEQQDISSILKGGW